MCSLLRPAIVSLLLTGAALAQSPVSIVRVGDAIPGVGHVAAIELVFVDYAGTWTVQVSTDNPIVSEVVLTREGVLRQTGDLVPKPPGASLQSFGALTQEALLGTRVWTATLSGTAGGTADNHAIYEDLNVSASNLLIQSGAATSASTGDFPPGTVWTSFADYQGPGVDGVALLRGTVEDPTLPGNDESFVARCSHIYFGLCCMIDLLAQAGHPAPVVGQTIERVRLEPWTAAIDVGGNSPILRSCDLAGPTATDGCVFQSSGPPGAHVETLVAREGSASPVAGRTWGALETPSVDLNLAGRWTLRAELDASDPATDGIIVRDGAKFVQEGDSLPAIAPFVIDDLGRGRALLQPDGRVLWYAHWNDTSGPAEALFWEQQIVVRAGVTTVGGVPIVDLASDGGAFAMSSSGQFVVFRGSRAGGSEEVFLFDLGGMSTYCQSKPTSLSCYPTIGWSGSLPSASLGSGFVVRAYNTPGPAKGLLLYGTSGPASLPIQQGTLCVAAPIRRLSAATGGGTGTCFGALSRDFTAWIAGGADPTLVPGQWVHTQFWFRDPGYAPPMDFGLTKGLEFFILP